jgi:hypothetical protein
VPDIREEVVEEEGRIIIKRDLSLVLLDLQSSVTTGFASLGTALLGKADKADISRMEGRLGDHAGRISQLESWRHDREVAAQVHKERDEEMQEAQRRKWSRREKIFASAATAAIAAGSMLAILHP